MNKRIFKRIMSLVLVVVIAVSTMMVSAVSTSAETANENEYNYKITIKTGDMEQAGTSSRIDLFPYDCNGNCMKVMTFYGDKMSAEFGQNGTYVCTYTCENEIFNIGAAISTSTVFDNWNLEYIEIEYKDENATATRRLHYNKWLVDSIAYRDPNPEKYCVFPEKTTVTAPNVTYNFDIQTAGRYGKSSDKISIKVNGAYGSTSWHNVGKVADYTTDSAFFSDINVGTIKSISVQNNGSDGWYPEIIKITVGKKTTTIYGGRWIDDGKAVTLAVTDRVAKVTVQTDSHSGSGTDNDVLLKLVDEMGNSTGETNLSEIHPKFNAFERYDKATFYIYIPENFGKLKELKVCNSTIFGEFEWRLAYIDVTLDGETKVFPCYGKIVNDVYRTLNNTGYVYKVTVKTGDEKYAGTDNGVYLYAYDEKGKKIKSYWLDSEKNNFEKGDTDVFYIVSTKKIANIKMFLDLGIGSEWYLEYVQLDLMDVNNVVESTKYTFNKWIESNSDLIGPKSKEVLDVK